MQFDDVMQGYVSSRRRRQRRIVELIGLTEDLESRNSVAREQLEQLRFGITDLSKFPFSAFENCSCKDLLSQDL